MDPILFHIHHKYYVCVDKTKTGCSAKYPKNIFFNPKLDELIVNYHFGESELKIEYNDKKIVEELPKYCIPLIVQADIVIKATDRNIGTSLIKYFKNIEMKDKLLDIISLKMTKEEKLLEQRLASNFTDIIFGSCDSLSAENQGILDGFKALVSLTKRNGF